MKIFLLLIISIFLALNNTEGQTITGNTLNGAFYVQSKTVTAGEAIAQINVSGTALSALENCVEFSCCKLIVDVTSNKIWDLFEYSTVNQCYPQ